MISKNDLFSKGMEFVEKTGNKVSKIKESLLDFIPEVDFGFIEDKLISIGYKVPKIEIKLSIPPSISLEIDLENSIINELEKNKIEKSVNENYEKETETNKVLIKILQGLDYVAKVNDRIKFKNKKLNRVLIEGSLIPSVKLIYLDSEIISSNYLRDKNSKS